MSSSATWSKIAYNVNMVIAIVRAREVEKFN
jgi:hypothetical protein